MLLLLLIPLVLAFEPIEPEILFQWWEIDYNWPDNATRQSFIDSGEFIPSNNAITGIKFYDGITYLTVPRWFPGVPSTLNRVVLNSQNQPVLAPFPTWEMNEIGNPSALQYVQSMEIDTSGRMWIIDAGRLNIFADPSLVVNGPPKLVIYNIQTQEIERVFVFPDFVAPYNQSFLNDIALDQSRGVAYISDAGGPGAIIIYDYTSNQARRWSGPGTSVENTTIIIDDIVYSFSTPEDGIALSSDCDTLYYCPLSGVHLWSLPTNVLRDFSLPYYEWNVTLTTKAVDLGEKASQSDGLAVDEYGVLYFGLLGLNGVNAWNPRTPLSSQYPLTIYSETQVWIDTFAFDHNGGLLFTANRLQEFFTNTMNFSGPNPNFYVLRVPINADSYLAKQPAYSPPSSDDNDSDGMVIWLPIVTFLVGLAVAGIGVWCWAKKQPTEDGYSLE